MRKVSKPPVWIVAFFWMDLIPDTNQLNPEGLTDGSIASITGPFSSAEDARLYLKTHAALPKHWSRCGEVHAVYPPSIE